MSTSLEDIFSGTAAPTESPAEPAAEPKAEPPQEAAPEPAPEPKAEAEPKGEAAAEAPAEPEKPAETPPSEDAEKTVPHAALHEEREKHKKTRQQLEALTNQFKQLEPHLERLKTAEKGDAKADKPERDFYDDPAAFVQDGLAAIRRENNEAVLRSHLNLSEAHARARHEDYDAAMEVFVKKVEQNPLLRQQMLQQVDPGEWAYQIAKRATALEELGDPATARERLEAEIREKIKAEQEAEAAKAAEAEPAPEAPVPDLPKSLAGKRSAGARKGPTWSGPTPLTEILPPT